MKAVTGDSFEERISGFALRESFNNSIFVRENLFDGITGDRIVEKIVGGSLFNNPHCLFEILVDIACEEMCVRSLLRE